MDRGAWQTTVHGVAELGRTRRLTLSLSFCLPSVSSPAGESKNHGNGIWV